MNKPAPLLLSISTLALLSLFWFNQITKSTPSEREKLEAAMAFFEQQYNELNIPGLVLSYETGLRNLSTKATLEKQQAFFLNLEEKLDDIDVSLLPENLRLEYNILQYEQALNLERISLSLPFVENRYDIHDKGIYHIENGKAWYKYLVKNWTSGDLSPEEIALYGKAEVAKIKQEMKKIEATFSNFLEVHHSDKFLSNDPQEIQQEFVKTKKRVDQYLFQHFPDFERLTEVNIVRGTNSALVQVPGYYNNNTFYYNLFDQPFDLSKTDWLFIHEGNPGHHFQINYENTVDVPAYRSGLSYVGFREGWAAYVEDLGHEVGLYQTPHHYYSKWEWDLIRSVRLILDVGINYRGWTDAQAMTEWQKYIKNKDDIGDREIKRMRRWPAQVLSYKVGAKAIQETREAAQLREGDDFNLKAFHTKLLSKSSIPVRLIDKLF